MKDSDPNGLPLWPMEAADAQGDEGGADDHQDGGRHMRATICCGFVHHLAGASELGQQIMDHSQSSGRHFGPTLHDQCFPVSRDTESARRMHWRVWMRDELNGV